MRAILAAMLFLVGFSMAQGQETLTRDEALKAAFQLCRDLPKMLDTPIPTDPDVKRAAGVHGDKRGGLILPESKLCQETVAKAGPEAVAIGQLWLLKVAPVVGGQTAQADQLKLVTVSGDQETAAVALCALGVRQGDDGRPELLVYGKDQAPLLHVALTPISDKQENPIEISAERQGDGALLTLKILGKYSASFVVSLCD